MLVDNAPVLCREVLVMVMRKHQRYFPVHDAGGALLPAFVTVANGAIDKPTVRVRQSLCCHCLRSPQVAICQCLRLGLVVMPWA